mgnify:CR=1 FL=1|jgi:hypothetical protein
MGKHQLFKETPPIELVIKIAQCFGFENLNDKGCICKKYFTTMNVIEKMNALLPELKKYYLPCKAKTYLTELNNNSIMTILRQILRPHNYVIISREKYINREKLINYNLVNKNEIELEPIKPVNKENANVVSFS